MKPAQLSFTLRRVANAIDQSERPSREFVLATLKKILGTIDGLEGTYPPGTTKNEHGVPVNEDGEELLSQEEIDQLDRDLEESLKYDQTEDEYDPLDGIDNFDDLPPPRHYRR